MITFSDIFHLTMDKCPKEDFVDCKSHITPSDAQDKNSPESASNSDHNYFDVREELLFSDSKETTTQEFCMDINNSEQTSQISENTRKLTLKNFDSFSRFTLIIERLSLDKYKNIISTPKKKNRKTKPAKKVPKVKDIQQFGPTRTRTGSRKQQLIEDQITKISLEAVPKHSQPLTMTVESVQIEQPPEKVEIIEMPEIIELETPFNPEKVESPASECVDKPDNSECVDKHDVPVVCQQSMDNSPLELDNTPKDKEIIPPSIHQYAEEDIINIRVSPTLFPDSPSHKKEEVVVSPKYCIPKTKPIPRKKDDFHHSPIRFEREESKPENDSSKTRDSKRSPLRKSPTRRRTRSPRTSPIRSGQPKRSPLRRSPGRSPSKRSPRRNTSKKSPRRSSPRRRTPRNSPSRSNSRRSPRDSQSRSSPRRSPSKRKRSPSPYRRSPGRRTPPRRSPPRSPARRNSPMRSPFRRSPIRRSPIRRSPIRGSPSRRSPIRRSPIRRSPIRGSPSRRSPIRRSPPRSPLRRSPLRRSPLRRSPIRRSPPRRSPTRWSPSRRSPLRRSPLRRSPYRRSPLRRSPFRRSPLRSPLRSPPRLSPLRNNSLDRRISPWPHRRSPYRRSPPPRGPYERPLLGSSTGMDHRLSPPRQQSSTGGPLGRQMPPPDNPRRERSRSPIWESGPGRDRPFDAFRDDPFRTQPTPNISINLASRLDRNTNNPEKKLFRVESPISMSISPPTSTHEDDGDTMRIVSRSSIRNRIGHNALAPMRHQRSSSSSPIRRPFNIRDEFFDRDSISPHFQDESREFVPPLPSHPYMDPSRGPKLPMVSFNYNPAIDAPMQLSQQRPFKSPTIESYNILDRMFKDVECQKRDISLYLPTEHYIPKDLPPPLPSETDKDPTLVPFPERHVICPLCKSVLYAKRYEFHLRGKCMFRSQLALDPPENPDEHPTPELSYAKQISPGTLLTHSVDKSALILIPPVEKRPFKCPNKNCHFQGVIESIREHYAKAHFYINCFHCKQSLVDPNTFPTHLSHCLNKSPIVCHLCACHYPLLNSFSLGHHILNQHDTETCLICLQKMSWKTFQSHVTRCMFNNQHRYRCPICNGSNRIDTLATHLLTKHYRDVCPICKHMTGKKSIIHVSKCFLDATGMNLTFIRPDNKVKCTLCSYQTSFYEIASHYIKIHATTKCIFCELVFDVKEYANHIGLCCQKYDGLPMTSLHQRRPPILNVPAQLQAPTYDNPVYTPVSQSLNPNEKLESGPAYRFGGQRPFPNIRLAQPNTTPNFLPNQQGSFRNKVPGRFDSL